VGRHVEKFIGDAVMAAFLALRIAHEDDAERAVRAASHWSKAVQELNAARARARMASGPR